MSYFNTLNQPFIDHKHVDIHSTEVLTGGGEAKGAESFRDTFRKLMKAIEALPRGEKICLAFTHTHLYTEYSVAHGHSLPPPPPPPAESIHVSSEGKTCFIWNSFLFLTLPFFFFNLSLIKF